MSNFDKAVEIIGELATEYGQPGGDELFGLDEDAALALKENGLLAPDLPEPDVVKLCGDVKYFVDIGNQVRYDKGSKFVQVMNGSPLLISEARNLAYALLAAADYAEKEQSNESRK